MSVCFRSQAESRSIKPFKRDAWGHCLPSNVTEDGVSCFNDRTFSLPPALHLSSPISRDIAIVSLRYPLSISPALPQQGAMPSLVLSFTQTYIARYPILRQITRYYLRNTPGKQARNRFAMLSLKVSRYMRSTAAGPLSPAPHLDIKKSTK